MRLALKGGLCIAALACATTLSAGYPPTASLEEINARLLKVEANMSDVLPRAVRTAKVASVLDQTEVQMGRLAQAEGYDQWALRQNYLLLRGSLARIFVEYEYRADACRDSAPADAECDQANNLTIALEAEYPLAWAEYNSGTIERETDNEQARLLLSRAIDHFSHPLPLLHDRNLIRENLLGRAYCELEFGRYVRHQYRNAAMDFGQIVADGRKTPQYNNAARGLAEALEGLDEGGGSIVPLTMKKEID